MMASSATSLLPFPSVHGYFEKDCLEKSGIRSSQMSGNLQDTEGGCVGRSLPKDRTSTHFLQLTCTDVTQGLCVATIFIQRRIISDYEQGALQSLYTVLFVASVYFLKFSSFMIEGNCIIYRQTILMRHRGLHCILMKITSPTRKEY